MHETIPENRTLAPTVTDGLSGCDGPHIDCGDAAGGRGVAIDGLYVPVLHDGDGDYLPGDVVDGRWADDRPPRVFHPHGSAVAGYTRLAAEGRADDPARPGPGPGVVGATGPGSTPGGAA